MTTFEKLWPKLRRSKRYREEFVAQHARQAIPFQIAALLKQHGLTQEELAKRGGVNQSSVSRAIDPSYGKMSLETLVRIAAGFDVAFVGRFVRFSDLPKWFDDLTNEPFEVPTFEQEDAALDVVANDAMAQEFRRMMLGIEVNSIDAGAAMSLPAQPEDGAMSRSDLPRNVLKWDPTRGHGQEGLAHAIPQTDPEASVSSILAEMREQNG